jgi:hypothetical protein
LVVEAWPGVVDQVGVERRALGNLSINAWLGLCHSQGRKCLTKFQERVGRIHKEEFVLPRRMAGAGDGRKAL